MVGELVLVDKKTTEQGEKRNWKTEREKKSSISGKCAHIDMTKKEEAVTCVVE